MLLIMTVELRHLRSFVLTAETVSFSVADSQWKIKIKDYEQQRKISS